jgi:hypothetical protein
MELTAKVAELVETARRIADSFEEGAAQAERYASLIDEIEDEVISGVMQGGLAGSLLREITARERAIEAMKLARARFIRRHGQILKSRGG